MSKYLKDVQSIATISGKIAAKLGNSNSPGEFNVSKNMKRSNIYPYFTFPGYFQSDWLRGTSDVTSSN